MPEEQPNNLGFIEIEEEADQPDPTRRLLITKGPFTLALIAGQVSGWFSKEFFDGLHRQPSKAEVNTEEIRENLMRMLGNRWATFYTEQAGIANRYGTAVFPHLQADLHTIGSGQADAEMVDIYRPEGWGTKALPELKIAEALRVLDQYQFDSFDQVDQFRNVLGAIARTFPGLLIASKPFTVKQTSVGNQNFELIQEQGIIGIPTHNPIYKNDRLMIQVLLNMFNYPFAGANYNRETMQRLKPFISVKSLHTYLRLSSLAARELVEVDIDDGVFPFTDAVKAFRESGYNDMKPDQQEVVKYLITAGFENDFTNLEDYIYGADQERLLYSLYQLREVGARSLIQLVNPDEKVSSGPLHAVDLVMAHLSPAPPVTPPTHGLNA